MFNIQGSELIFLLLVALIVLGPEKLPDAIRKFGRAYAEFKKMANGFQGELKQALDEPMRELRDTADAMRAAANFDITGDAPAAAADPSAPAAPPVRREQGLNFGSANPRRTEPAPAAEPAATADEPARPQGLNFGSANPRRAERQQETAEELVVPETPDTAVVPSSPEAPEAPAPPAKKERPPGGTPVPRNRPAATPAAPPAAPPESAPVAEDAIE